MPLCIPAWFFILSEWIYNKIIAYFTFKVNVWSAIKNDLPTKKVILVMFFNPVARSGTAVVVLGSVQAFYKGNALPSHEA